MSSQDKPDERITSAIQAIKSHVRSNSDDYNRGSQRVTDLSLRLNEHLNAATQDALFDLFSFAINRARTSDVCRDVIVTLRTHRNLIGDECAKALDTYDAKQEGRVSPSKPERTIAPDTWRRAFVPADYKAA